ncbi:MAG: dihydrolipoamide acetyltransferase family protein [Acidimicrobiales bacterium]
MPQLREFRLPDLGEGLTEGEILGWMVSEGDTIALNQPIVEVETAKAAVEVPSPYAGTVVKLHHLAGETVDVGTTIITVDTDAGAVTSEPPPEPGDARHATPSGGPRPSADDLVPTLPHTHEPEAGLIGGAAPGGRTAVLVGYGPKTTAAVRRPRKGSRPTPPPAMTATVPAAATAGTAGRPARALAKPPVRKLARELGVDLGALVGSGDGGTITRDDVRSATRGEPGARAAGSRAATRVPIKGVRKLTAESMVASAFSAPHVTEFLTCDVTAAMDLVASLRRLPDFADCKVTPLTIVAKALLVACGRHPGVNASWDEPAQEIVLHGGVNLGIAAATPRGLVVPNIKDADLLSLPELARSLTTLATVAKDGKTQPADMTGGTITITNVGVFGVDTGTPIINPGEAAILCVGAVRDTPWVVDGAIAVRKVTTLGLSFDHRMVDGQLGSEFLADVGTMLSDPAALIAWS